MGRLRAVRDTAIGMSATMGFLLFGIPLSPLGGGLVVGVLQRTNPQRAALYGLIAGVLAWVTLFVAIFGPDGRTITLLLSVEFLSFALLSGILGALGGLIGAFVAEKVASSDRFSS